MTMTKRDVADIALVVLALWFLVQSSYHLLASCFTLFTVGMSNGTTGFQIGAWVGLGQLVAQLICAGCLLLLRPFLLNLLFPDAGLKDIVLPGEAVTLADYAFWIRLFGLFSGMSAAMQLVAKCIGIFVLRQQHPSDLRLGMDLSLTIRREEYTLVAAVMLSLLVIWQAGAISRLVRAIGSSGKPPVEIP